MKKRKAISKWLDLSSKEDEKSLQVLPDEIQLIIQKRKNKEELELEELNKYYYFLKTSPKELSYRALKNNFIYKEILKSSRFTAFMIYLIAIFGMLYNHYNFLLILLIVAPVSIITEAILKGLYNKFLKSEYQEELKNVEKTLLKDETLGIKPHYIPQKYLASASLEKHENYDYNPIQERLTNLIRKINASELEEKLKKINTIQEWGIYYSYKCAEDPANYNYYVDIALKGLDYYEENFLGKPRVRK